jgi:hypothetical protein
MPADLTVRYFRPVTTQMGTASVAMATASLRATATAMGMDGDIDGRPTQALLASPTGPRVVYTVCENGWMDGWIDDVADNTHRKLRVCHAAAAS